MNLQGEREPLRPAAAGLVPLGKGDRSFEGKARVSAANTIFGQGRVPDRAFEFMATVIVTNIAISNVQLNRDFHFIIISFVPLNNYIQIMIKNSIQMRKIQIHWVNPKAIYLTGFFELNYHSLIF